MLWEEPIPLFDTAREGTFYGLKAQSERPRPRERTTGPRDDYSQLLGFSSSLYRDLDVCILKAKISMLPAAFSAHLNEKVPSEKFEYHSEWVVAVKKEVDTVLLPMVRGRAPQPKPITRPRPRF